MLEPISVTKYKNAHPVDTSKIERKAKQKLSSNKLDLHKGKQA